MVPFSGNCPKNVSKDAKYGINYFSAPIDARPQVMAPVVERLTGT